MQTFFITLFRSAPTLLQVNRFFRIAYASYLNCEGDEADVEL